jgi:hypothetical protein
LLRLTSHKLPSSSPKLSLFTLHQAHSLSYFLQFTTSTTSAKYLLSSFLPALFYLGWHYLHLAKLLNCPSSDSVPSTHSPRLHHKIPELSLASIWWSIMACTIKKKQHSLTLNFGGEELRIFKHVLSFVLWWFS